MTLIAIGSPGGSGTGPSPEGLQLGETSTTAYRGDRGKIAYDFSQTPITKSTVGLGNVDNTSDLNKPISTATQAALDNLQSEIDSSNSDISTLQTNVSTLQTNVTNLQNTTSGLNTRVTTLESSVTDLQSDVSTLQTTTSGLQTEVNDLQSDVSTLQTDVSTLETLTTNTSEEVTSLQTDVSDLQSNVSTAINDISTLQTDVTDLQSDVSTLQSDNSTNKSNISTLQSQMLLKANIDSPAFTGTPTAPTASSGTNTTQIATTAFVTTAVNNSLASTNDNLNTKVDKVPGMGLSTNDYTTAEKTKLAGIATGATANSTDAYLLNRANHTGTQDGATVLYSLTSGTNTPIANNDNFDLVAAKLQTQINTINTNLFNKVYYVSQNGSDLNDGLSDRTPKLTLAAATALAGGAGNQIQIFPGTYNEDITITNQNTSIISSNNEIGSLINFTGTITMSHTASSNRLNGISPANLSHTAAGTLRITNCNVNTMFTKSGSGYLEASYTAFDNGDIQVTGAGVSVFANGCKIKTITVNNSSAVVGIYNPISCSKVTVTSGTVVISDAIVYAPANGQSALDATSGTVLQLVNVTFLNPNNTPAIINLPSGVICSYRNIVYDDVNSVVASTDPGFKQYFSNLYVAGMDGANITDINASNLSSGTVPAARMPASGITAGTYRSLTIDSTGRATSGTNPTTLLDYGITGCTDTELSYLSGVTSSVQTQINGLQTQINSKAGLASPAFTGTPTAPTATAGTNTTQIATTAFVTSAVSSAVTTLGNNLNASNITSGTVPIANLPASGITAGTYRSLTIDTLGRATAGTNPTTLLAYGILACTDTELGYVSGVTSSIQSQLNLKAPLASPSFTGTPLAPTATAGTNTTQIASTAFVTSAVSGLGSAINASNITSGTLNAARLPTSGITGGTYRSLTIDSTGRATSGTNPTTLAGYGIVACTDTELGYVSGVTSSIQSQLNLKAPLASPTFTGIPAAPTATSGTNTTQLATTAFVTSAVTTLGSSLNASNITSGTVPTANLPTSGISAGTYRSLTIDTLGRATAGTNPTTLAGYGIVACTDTELGYVSGVTSSIQTQLNLKAPLASPTFTGIPAAPTAAVNTNTTQIASTAFVTAAITGLSVNVGNAIYEIVSGTATTTNPADYLTNKDLFILVSASGKTIVLPKINTTYSWGDVPDSSTVPLGTRINITTKTIVSTTLNSFSSSYPMVDPQAAGWVGINSRTLMLGANAKYVAMMYSGSPYWVLSF